MGQCPGITRPVSEPPLHQARRLGPRSWPRGAVRPDCIISIPAGRSAPLRLSDVELRQARERVAPLLAAAQGTMDRLYQAVGASGCCVLLADGEGVPVDRRGTPCDDATFQSWGLWTGALWSEEHEGTNGIGTCVVEQRPLTIDRDQHFFTRNTLLSCTAVPIYDHEAAFAGVLDVSSCRADRTDAFSNLIALAAGEAARRIEADLFRRAFAHARIVLTQGADGQAGGLVAVDADDLVIGATRSARVALGIAPGRPCSRCPRPTSSAAIPRMTILPAASARCCSGRCCARTAMFRPPPRPSASAAPRCTGSSSGSS